MFACYCDNVFQQINVDKNVKLETVSIVELLQNRQHGQLHPTFKLACVV